jgi:hypothetical protein
MNLRIMAVVALVTSISVAGMLLASQDRFTRERRTASRSPNSGVTESPR